MDSLAPVFRALGDPVRLAMVMRLSAGEPFTVSAVSQGFGISRQGARKHLQILADANLVHFQPKGRETRVQLDPETLEKAKAFIGQLEARWDDRLQALKRFAEGTTPDP